MSARHINGRGQCRGIEIAPGEWSGCRGLSDCPSCGGELPGDCADRPVVFGVDMAHPGSDRSVRPRPSVPLDEDIAAHDLCDADRDSLP